MQEKKAHITTKDFLVSGEEFSLHENQTYGFLETKPQPKEEALAKYYESDAYISHTDANKGLLSSLYQMVKKYSLSKKVRLINKCNGNNGSILDIGAGTGEFLKVAKEKGWQVAGVEVNEKARHISEAKGITLLESIDAIVGKQFDVITLWHVLEHLPNVEQQIEKIYSLLKKEGILIIAVPNFNSFDAKHYKEFWAAYDTPRHLWHFSQTSIKNLFGNKFTLRKTLPMIFDAFYVSLLSEKYKTGKSFSLKSFWIGLRSNSKAWHTKEYSSLIYVLEKDK